MSTHRALPAEALDGFIAEMNLGRLLGELADR